MKNNILRWLSLILAFSYFYAGWFLLLYEQQIKEAAVKPQYNINFLVVGIAITERYKQRGDEYCTEALHCATCHVKGTLADCEEKKKLWLYVVISHGISVIISSPLFCG